MKVIDGVEKMKRTEKIRVLLADDHMIFRQGLRALLEGEPDMKVVGESSNGADLIEVLKGMAPDVIVMDIAMPQVNGLQATRAILSNNPKVHVLILSMSGDETDVEQAIQAGVSGYLVKETAASDLINAIREVKKGNAFFSPSIARILLAKKQATGQGNLGRTLTSREKEILKLIAASKTNKDIAILLNISPKTVDKHRGQIMTKLNIHDIAGLTRYAISNGLLKQA